MAQITQFKDIISLWPSAADFGRDIDIDEGSAQAMKRRNSVSSKYWDLVVRAANKRGIQNISYEALAKIARMKLPKKPKRRSK